MVGTEDGLISIYTQFCALCRKNETSLPILNQFSNVIKGSLLNFAEKFCLHSHVLTLDVSAMVVKPGKLFQLHLVSSTAGQRLVVFSTCNTQTYTSPISAGLLYSFS